MDVFQAVKQMRLNRTQFIDNMVRRLPSDGFVDRYACWLANVLVGWLAGWAFCWLAGQFAG